MFEVRSEIADIEEMKQRARSAGAKLRHYYSFWDKIFVPKKGEIDLNLRTIRLRVMDTSTRPGHKATVTEKKTLWSETSKTDRIVLCEVFDIESEARLFVTVNYADSLKLELAYFREGWEYEWENPESRDLCYLHIEDIKISGFPPTIEIEAETEKGLCECCEKLDVREIFFYSVPELVRQRLHLLSNEPKG